MKKIAVLGFLLCLSSMAFCQQPLVLSDVVRLDSAISSKDLYARALVWLANYYDDSALVIRLKDEENCLIIGKASFYYAPKVKCNPASVDGTISYTIKIYCKAGRYKYEIGGFMHQAVILYESQTNAIDFGLITDSETCKKEINYPSVPLSDNNHKEDVWKDMNNQIRDFVNGLVGELKVTMAEKIKTKQTDW